MWKLDTENSIIGTGTLSIVFAIIYLFVGDSCKYASYDFGIHVAGLQIVGSCILIIGVVYDHYKLYIAWMITTSFFLYLMVYSSVILISCNGWLFVILIFAPITVYLGYALYWVWMAFNRLRKDKTPMPPYANVPVKNDIFIPI